jgi:hypothetical protein
MAIRVSVQAATEDECVEGLARLVDAGFQPVMMPRYMTDGRWLARAVPAPATKAPTVQADGRGSVVSG